MANEVLIRVLERKRKYVWPEAQLNFWLIVMIAAAATIVGVFTYFMQLNSVFRLGNPPWYAHFPTFAPHSLSTNQLYPLQDISLQHSYRLPLPPLPSHDPRPNPTTATPTGHCRPRLLHSFRALPYRPHRNRNPALRPYWLSKQLLQPVQTKSRPCERRGDAGVVGDAGNMSGLESRICVLYCGHGVFAVDDGYGVSS